MTDALPERRQPLIDPSGRPLKRAGFEAAFALGIILVWLVVLVLIIWSMGRDRAESGPFASLMLTGIAFVSWWAAGDIAGRRMLVWPGSALGLIGPLSLGFAVAFSTPELRVGPDQTRLAIVSGVAGLGMIPFLFRYRLPGLVSPVVTFSLVSLFLFLYGTDMNRLRELEGFSPRGIVASLMNEPAFAAGFGALAAGAAWLARRLDLEGDDFGLAAARPLHLIGNGVCALLVGRALGALPLGLDIAALALAFAVAWAWALRVNRIAVLFAMQFAMAKPMVLAIAEVQGVTMTLELWTEVLFGMLIVQMATWPALHRLSRELDWTLGPGGIVPPSERPGSSVFWRYWPYANEERLDAWEAKRRARRSSPRRAGAVSGGAPAQRTEGP